MGNFNQRLSTALAICISASSPVVVAQSETGVLEEVVITAQRRSTDLQTTAAAVSAYSNNQLKEQSITDVEDLGQFNTSMDVSLYQGEAQVYIRGIGYSGIIGGTDSSTALHIDGVYMSRSSAAVPGFFDIDRVEVVRGPQGTLYGRNATSGSVNLIPKKPTEAFSAEAALSIGDYNHRKVFGAVSGSLSSNVQARLAVQAEKRDGYTTVQRVDGSRDEVEDKDDFTARLTVSFQPTDSVDITLTADHYEADDSASVWLFFDPGVGTNPFFRSYVQDQGGFLPVPFSRSDAQSEIDHVNKPKISGLTNRIEWDWGEYRLSSLTAYKKTRPYNLNDLDATAGFGVTQFRSEDHEQISQEFQLSSPKGETFEWILGAYYFEEENDVRNEYALPFADEQFGLPSDDDCCLLKLNGRAETESYALFSELYYDLNDNIELVLGARYSEETRGGNNAVVFENFIPGLLDNVAAFQEETFQSFTPKVGLNVTLSDEVFIYGSISEGFKSGGFNVGSYQNTPFNPEEITSYELGLKSELMENKVRLNSALFYYDYSDLQVQDVEGNNTVVRNAANADIWGLEIEGTALLNSAIQLDFGYTYLDAQFKDVLLADPKQPALGIQQLDGNQLPRAPEHKVVFGIAYNKELGNGEINARLDFSWQDKIYFSAFNVDAMSQDDYTWAKATVSYQTGSNWKFSAYLDNISDEAVASNATFNGDIIDSTVTGNMAPPKTFGLEASYIY